MTLELPDIYVIYSCMLFIAIRHIRRAAGSITFFNRDNVICCPLNERNRIIQSTT